jgi:hypothetical protein
MSQPWTVISMAPVTATMLAVSSRSPIAAGRPAAAVEVCSAASSAAQPRDRAGSPRRPADADAAGADRLGQHHLGRVGDVPSKIARSQVGQGVGRDSSCGVTSAALASA